MASNIQKSNVWRLSRKQAGSAQLTLSKGAVHRLHPVPPAIVIISGCAWVSWNGEDILLNKGEGIQFSQKDDDPIISAVGTASLTFEMIG